MFPEAGQNGLVRYFNPLIFRKRIELLVNFSFQEVVIGPRKNRMKDLNFFIDQTFAAVGFEFLFCRGFEIFPIFIL